jgi:hypothetical protein
MYTQAYIPFRGYFRSPFSNFKGAATTLAEALEIGYAGFGEIACTETEREGISAFSEKRKPEFKK